MTSWIYKITKEETMSEIKGVSNLLNVNENTVKSTKTAKTGNASFSSYMEETKSLDDIFEEASDKYNVPVVLLKAVGKAESDFRADAVSRSGAQGIMQLMPKTAEYLGVKDSFDPEQNINGGAKYLAELLDKYDGNTSLALAAYNAGMNNVKKYGGIPPFEETQNYVVKVTKYMQQNLEAGDAVVSTADTGAAKLTAAAAVTRPALNWYIAPSEQTQKANAAQVSDVFDSIFSYQDYLKLLELFFNDNEEQENY
jgi:hypothetical protein